MQCILLRQMMIAYTGEDFPKRTCCLKKKCAWWDIDLEQCCEVTKAKALDRIERILTDIKDKMPHAGQFTG